MSEKLNPLGVPRFMTDEDKTKKLPKKQNVGEGLRKITPDPEDKHKVEKAKKDDIPTKHKGKDGGK